MPLHRLLLAAGVATAALLSVPAQGSLLCESQSSLHACSLKLAQICQPAPPSCGVRSPICIQYGSSCCVRWHCI